MQSIREQEGTEPGDAGAKRGVATPGARGLGVDETVPRWPGGADDLVEGTIENRKALADLTGFERFDAQPPLVLDHTHLEGALVERAVVVEPELAERPKSKLLLMLDEEVESRAAALDVDRLPPGRPRPPGVELRRGVDPGEIEIDHGDLVHATAGQRPRDAGADDPAAHDQDVDTARHTPSLAGC